MSMNLIAMLVSLAMMLTGMGGAVQTDAALPATQTARTLTLSNINVTWNGEALRLGPQAHIGVSTDGKRALYDFGVDLDGKTLMPVQVVADDTGITALSANSGLAVTVTAEALAGLAERLEAQVNASIAGAGGDNAELVKFLTEDYMPAYVGLLQLAMDPDRREEINTKVNAVFDRVIDRGEGTPEVLDVDGTKMDVKAYSYSVDAMQMAALSDAVYAEISELNAYYSALFKLYGMLPEESGLRGLDSFTALFEKFGVQMRLDIDEKRSDDGTVDEMDGVLTIDPSSMLNLPHTDAGVAAAVAGALPADGEPAAAEPEATEPEAAEAVTEATEPEATEPEATEAVTEATEPEATAEPEAAEAEATAEPEGAEAEAAEPAALEPIVMNLHSTRLPDYSDSSVSCVYAVDGHRTVEFSMTGTENGGIMDMEATMFVTRDGKKTHGGRVSAFLTHDELGTVSYSLNMKAVKQDRAKVDAAFYGVEYPDGTSENTVDVEARTPNKSVAVSFDLNVTADAIEDATAKVEPACVIDDLSDEGMRALGQDAEAIGAIMQALGALTADYRTLKADPGVKDLRSLVRGKGLPIDVDELDETEFDIDADFGGEPEGDDESEGEDREYALVVDDDGAFDFEDEPVEDDGVLAFQQPKLNWLPDGWTVSATETDTAYDVVTLNIVDANGEEAAYAIFLQDPEAETANYIVQADGKVIDGRMMNVTDFNEGGLSVTVSENGLYGNLMFTSEAIELDTIGKIVAGIEF